MEWAIFGPVEMIDGGKGVGIGTKAITSTTKTGAKVRDKNTRGEKYTCVFQNSMCMVKKLLSMLRYVSSCINLFT